MPEEEQEEQRGSMLDKVKSWFSGMGSGGWKVPAACGVIAAIAISGPIGLGVAGGIWAASKIKDAIGIKDRAKNAALMGVGAATCATSTAVGAAIGSAMFPVVGTLVGATVGFVGGLVASKGVTATVRDKHMNKSPVSESPGQSPSNPPMKTKKEPMRAKNITPSQSPTKARTSSIGRQ